MRRTVYLDYHATTPVDPRVLRRCCLIRREVRQCSKPRPLVRVGRGEGGRSGTPADRGARRRRPREIVFTSGATESNNLAIKGSGAGPHRHHGDRAQVRAPVGPPRSAAASRCSRRAPTDSWTSTVSARRSAASRRSSASCTRTTRSARCSRCARSAPLPRARSAPSFRRRSGLRQDPDRCGGRRHRPAVHHRAQDVWTQGCRRAVRAAPQGAPSAADRRRRTRGRHALRDPQRARDRGLRRGRGIAARGDAGGGRAPRRPPPTVCCARSSRSRSEDERRRWMHRLPHNLNVAWTGSRRTPSC